jgi:C4-type Zn-finger protein
MDVRLTKWCYSCGYVEDVDTLEIERPLLISFNLESEDNLTCARCQTKAVRLDISEIVKERHGITSK